MNPNSFSAQSLHVTNVKERVPWEHSAERKRGIPSAEDPLTYR